MPQRSPAAPLKNIFFWLAVAMTALYLIQLHFLTALRTELLDFNLFLAAAERAQEGKSLYQQPYNVIAFDGSVQRLDYYYPPFLALGLSLLQKCAPSAVKIIWCFGNLLVISITGFLLWRYLRTAPLLQNFSSRALILLSFWILLGFEPLFWTTIEGQVNTIVLVLILSSMIILNRGGYRWPVAALVGAAWIKISPVLLLFPLILRRPAIAIYWIVLFSLGAFGAFLLIPSGIRHLWDFFLRFPTLAVGTYEAHYQSNLSLTTRIGLMLNPEMALITKIVIGVAVVFGCLRLRKASAEASIALCVIGMLLLSPVLWSHHLLWLLIPLLYLLKSFPAPHGSKGKWQKYLTAWGLLYVGAGQVRTLTYILIAEAPLFTNFAVILPNFLCVAIGIWVYCNASLQRQNAPNS